MGYYSPIGAWRNITPVEPAYIYSLSASSHTVQVRAIRSGDSTSIPVPKQANGGFALGILFGVPLLTLDPESGEYGDNGDTLIFRVTDITPERQSDYINYLGKAAISIYNMTSGNEQFLFTNININYREYVDSSTYAYAQDTTTYSILHKNDNDLYCIGFATNCYIERAPAAHPDRLVYFAQYGQGAIFREDQLPQGYRFVISKGPDDDPNYDPDNPGDEEEGGGGNHNKPREAVPIPSLPPISAASAGFLTLYHLSTPEMWVFGQDCIASDVWEAIRLFFSNPMDFIAGCAIVPFTPTGNSVWYPKFGATVFQHAYSKVDNQYVSIDCGNLYIEPFFKSFLDYAPYTRIGIFLPYIGYRELNVDEVMGLQINVTYHCDCLSGDCIAFISTSVIGPEGPQVPIVLAQFTGNCAVQVPFATVAFDNLISNSVSMLTNAIPAVMGVKESIPSSVDAAMRATHSQSGDVQRGGNIGSSNGLMGVQTPYIIRRVPIQNVPAQYISQKGYPSNISGTLSEFSGFAKVDDIQLNNIPAMEPEREEIKQLLREGVLL